VALAGLAADAIGYCTSVTDCLPGHLKNLQQHPAALQGKLEAVVGVSYVFFGSCYSNYIM